MSNDKLGAAISNFARAFYDVKKLEHQRLAVEYSNTSQKED